MTDYRDIVIIRDRVTADLPNDTVIPYRVTHDIVEVRTCADGKPVISVKESVHIKGFAGLTTTFSRWSTQTHDLISQRDDGAIVIRSYRHKNRAWHTSVHYIEPFDGFLGVWSIYWI